VNESRSFQTIAASGGFEVGWEEESNNEEEADEADDEIGLELEEVAVDDITGGVEAEWAEEDEKALATEVAENEEDEAAGGWFATLANENV